MKKIAFLILWYCGSISHLQACKCALTPHTEPCELRGSDRSAFVGTVVDVHPRAEDLARLVESADSALARRLRRYASCWTDPNACTTPDGDLDLEYDLFPDPARVRQLVMTLASPEDRLRMAAADEEEFEELANKYLLPYLSVEYKVKIDETVAGSHAATATIVYDLNSCSWGFSKGDRALFVLDKNDRGENIARLCGGTQLIQAESQSWQRYQQVKSTPERSLLFGFVDARPPKNPYVFSPQQPVEPRALVPVLIEGPSGPIELRTDSHGAFSVPNLTPGNYTVSLIGAPESRIVELRAGACTFVPFTPSPVPSPSAPPTTPALVVPSAPTLPAPPPAPPR